MWIISLGKRRISIMNWKLKDWILLWIMQELFLLGPREWLLTSLSNSLNLIVLRVKSNNWLGMKRFSTKSRFGNWWTSWKGNIRPWIISDTRPKTKQRNLKSKSWKSKNSSSSSSKKTKTKSWKHSKNNSRMSSTSSSERWATKRTDWPGLERTEKNSSTNRPIQSSTWTRNSW